MTEVEKPKTPKFSQRDFGVASFKRNEWHLTLMEAHSMDDVMNGRLWNDILGKPTRGDVVEAYKPDSGEFAKFLITEVGAGFIKLGKIEGYTPKEVSIPDGSLAIKWNVGKRSFDVIRRGDNYVMAKDFQSKASAVEWIEDHLKKMAA